MKEKIIETAGQAWRYLGEHGETNISSLAKALGQTEAIVFQALGWLAREDKINYTSKNRKTFVALVDSEKEAFKQFNSEQDAQQEGGNGKKIVRNRLKQAV